MSYRNSLKKLDTTEYPMSAILCAVDDALENNLLKYGKKYTLKEIVDLENPKLWATMNNYEARCAGWTFASLVERNYPELAVINAGENQTRKYVLIDY